MLAPLLSLNEKMPGDVAADVARRAARRRKAMGLTQAQLAEKSGVSLASLRRFEQTGQVSFASLVNLAFALGCEDDLETLFSRPCYASTRDVVRARRQSARQAG